MYGWSPIAPFPCMACIEYSFSLSPSCTLRLVLTSVLTDGNRNACRALRHFHSGVPGSGTADAYAAAAPFDDEATVFIDRYREVRRLIDQAMFSLLNRIQVSLSECTRAHFHRLRANCPFARTALYRFQRIRGSPIILSSTAPLTTLLGSLQVVIQPSALQTCMANVRHQIRRPCTLVYSLVFLSGTCGHIRVRHSYAVFLRFLCLEHVTFNHFRCVPFSSFSFLWFFFLAQHSISSTFISSLS